MNQHPNITISEQNESAGELDIGRTWDSVFHFVEKDQIPLVTTNLNRLWAHLAVSSRTDYGTANVQTKFKLMDSRTEARSNRRESESVAGTDDATTEVTTHIDEALRQLRAEIEKPAWTADNLEDVAGRALDEFLETSWQRWRNCPLGRAYQKSVRRENNSVPAPVLGG